MTSLKRNFNKRNHPCQELWYLETSTPIPLDGAIRTETQLGRKSKTYLTAATYLHYNGTKTTPDLLLVSSYISELTQRKVIDDPGSGHKLFIASIITNSKPMTSKMPIKGKHYRVFWSKNLEELKRQQEALHNTAEQAGKTEDVQAWRRQSAVLRQAILQAKRTTFNSFISTNCLPPTPK
nr:hypothetical protein HmN_000901900 [Hymenolepis microstoma]